MQILFLSLWNRKIIFDKFLSKRKKIINNIGSQPLQYINVISFGKNKMYADLNLIYVELEYCLVIDGYKFLYMIFTSKHIITYIC